MNTASKMTDKYYPIRQRVLWVGIIQMVFTGLALAGADIADGWAAWAIGVVDLLVLAGVLTVATKSAEKYTTPLDENGDPLSPDYERTSS